MKLLDVQNIGFSYDNTRDIFSDLSFSVDTGEVFCIIGPNGCGKSTLIDCILKLNAIKSGNILVGGIPISDMKPANQAEHMAYVPQSHKKTFGYTVLEIVCMGRTYASRIFDAPTAEEKQIAMEALKMVDMENFADRDYTRLSGGELQLVLIARALAQRSKLLIMDEPTAHLDFRHELNVMEKVAQLVKENGLSIVMATHFLNQAYFLENAGVNTRVGLMTNGNLSVIGKPSEVLVPSELARVFGIETEIATDASGDRQYILAIRNIRR